MSAMAGLASRLAPALPFLPAAWALLASQSVGGGWLGRRGGVLQPHGQLSFEFNDLLVALDQFLPQLFNLAAQALVFAFQPLRF